MNTCGGSIGSNRRSAAIRLPRTSLLVFPARPTRIFRRPSTCWTKCNTILSSVSSTRRARTRRRSKWEIRLPKETKQQRLLVLQEKQRAIQIRRNAELIGGIQEVLVEGRHASLGQWIGRTSNNRTLNFTHPDTGEKLAGRDVPAGTRDALRSQLLGRRECICGVMNSGEGVMEVEMKIRGLMMDPVTNMPIVILRDLNGNSVLPIWVGVYEANAIALEIEKVSTPRPMDSRSHQNVAAGPEYRPAQSGGE